MVMVEMVTFPPAEVRGWLVLAGECWQIQEIQDTRNTRYKKYKTQDLQETIGITMEAGEMPLNYRK